MSFTCNWVFLQWDIATFTEVKNRSEYFFHHWWADWKTHSAGTCAKASISHILWSLFSKSRSSQFNTHLALSVPLLEERAPNFSQIDVVLLLFFVLLIYVYFYVKQFESSRLNVPCLTMRVLQVGPKNNWQNNSK